MLRTIIIDDELHIRKIIGRIIEKNCPQVQVIAEADSVESGVNIIALHQPELVLLDVQLSDGSGFDLLQKINLPISFKVIFITAHEQYALSAIKASATDYILKPINPSELIASLQNVSDVVKKENTELKINLMISDRAKQEKNIALKTSDSFFLEKIANIVRCEADGNYTCFHFVNNKKLLVSKSLKEFDDQLSDFGFFRIHYAHLINLSYLELYDRTKEQALLKDKTSLPVARSRKHHLMEKLERM